MREGYGLTFWRSRVQADCGVSFLLPLAVVTGFVLVGI